MNNKFADHLESLFDQGLLFQDEVDFLQSVTKENNKQEFATLFCGRFENIKTRTSALFSLFQFLAQYHCIHRGEMLDSIDIEGLLDVRSETKWRSRFFVLQGFALESYEQIGDIKPKEIINLSPDLFVRDAPGAISNTSNRFGFEIVGSREVVTFAAVNEQARLQWTVSICRAVVAPRLIHLKAPLAFIATPVDIKKQMVSSEGTPSNLPDVAEEDETQVSHALAARESFKDTPRSPYFNTSPLKSNRKTLRKPSTEVNAGSKVDSSRDIESNSTSNDKSDPEVDIDMATIYGIRISGYLNKATIRSCRDEKLNSHNLLNRLVSTLQANSPSFRSKKGEASTSELNTPDKTLSPFSGKGAGSNSKYNTMPKMKSRFFVLENNLLSYYGSRKMFEEGQIPTGQLFLPSDCTVIREFEGAETTFDVITARRHLRLQAGTVEEKSSWVEMIEQVLVEGRKRQLLYESFRSFKFAQNGQPMKPKKRRPRKSLLPQMQRVARENEEKVEIWVTGDMKSGHKIGDIIVEQGAKPVNIRGEIYKQLGDKAPVKFKFCRKQEGIQGSLAKVALIRLSLMAKDGKLPMDDPEEKKEEGLFSNIFTKMTRSQEKDFVKLGVRPDDKSLPVILLCTFGLEEKSREELMEEMRNMQARIAELERSLAESMRHSGEPEEELAMSAIAAALYRLQNDGYLATDLSIKELEQNFQSLFDSQDFTRLFLNGDSPFVIVFQKMAHKPEIIRDLIDNLQKIFIDYNLFGSRVSAPWWKRKLKDPKMYNNPDKLFEWAKNEPWVEDEIERSFYLTTKQRGKKLRKQQTFIIRPKPSTKESRCDSFDNKENETSKPPLPLKPDALLKAQLKSRAETKSMKKELPKGLLASLNRTKA